MTAPPLYAVYNRDCGHVLGVHADRAVWDRVVAAMEAVGQWSYRTRLATDEDIAAVLRQDRCGKCEVTSESLARGKAGGSS